MVSIILRLAQEIDIEEIRDLLADDALGKTREDVTSAGLGAYKTSFVAIQASPDNELWVAQIGDEVVGTYQVTYIPYLSRGGSLRCLIEAVRTHRKYRGKGIGTQMMEFALEQARMRSCVMVQLTTDKTRTQTHKFYENLGFENTHEGMKIQL